MALWGVTVFQCVNIGSGFLRISRVPFETNAHVVEDLQAFKILLAD